VQSVDDDTQEAPRGQLRQEFGHKLEEALAVVDLGAVVGVGCVRVARAVDRRQHLKEVGNQPREEVARIQQLPLEIVRQCRRRRRSSSRVAIGCGAALGRLGSLALGSRLRWRR